MFVAKRNLVAAVLFLALVVLPCLTALVQDGPLKRPLRVDPQPIASDRSVKYDYDIIYVRAPRAAKGKDGKERLAMVWPDASQPFDMHASTDLMLLHPDGKDELLVA